MNKLLTVLLLAWLALAFAVRAQNPPPAPASGGLANPTASPFGAPSSDPGFVRFDIDFPGGPPGRLVQIITNRTRQALNVIVPTEYAATELPALSLRSVTVPQIFEAIGRSSARTVPRITGWNVSGGGVRTPSYQIANSSFGFRTAAAGPLAPDTVWYFFVDQPPQIPDVPEPPDPKSARSCRFYQLGAYLDRGELKVEDITTALETAWKMLGEKTMPDLKFHKETRLLIAVGESDKLALIDQVLTQLPNGAPIDPTTGLPLLKRPAGTPDPAMGLPPPSGPGAPVKNDRIIPPEPIKRPTARP
jgi:hypothetical protein